MTAARDRTTHRPAPAPADRRAARDAGNAAAAPVDGPENSPGGGADRGALPGGGSSEREDALRRVVAEVSAQVDLARVFEDVLSHSVALFGADRAGLWTMDADGSSYRLAAERNLPDSLLAAMPGSVGDPRLAAWRALTERRSLVLADPIRRGTTTEIRRAYRGLGIRTVCLVPILFMNEPLGVLVLYHHTRHPWPDDELALVASFANEMAVAIQNARLYQRVQRFAARLDSIRDLAGRLNHIHDVQGIGSTIVAEIRGLFLSDTARVYVVDQVAGTCEPVAFGGEFQGVSQPSADVLRVPIGEGLTGWVAAHNEPVRVTDTRRESRRVIVGADEGPESMLLAPMSYEGVVRGVVVVSKRGVGLYSADDLTTLSIFAGFAAQALANAESIERLNTQRVELEQRLIGQRSLLEVNERLQGPADPRLVLDHIADTLQTVVRWDNLTIYRVDREAGWRIAVLARDRYADLILAERDSIETGLTGWAIIHNEAVLTNEAHLDPRGVLVPGTPAEPEALVVVPLRAQGEVIGTLNVGRMGEADAQFSAAEFELIQLFAGQASIALQTADALAAAAARAERDALTRLRNHGAFQADLEAALHIGGPFATLMLDLDGFKTFNDRRGHAAGDRLLSGVADALAAGVRGPEGDRVYRYGGDEFSAILPGVGRSEARAIADRLAGLVEAVRTDGPDAFVSISVGVAAFPADGRTKDELVMAADSELYLEKAARRRSDGGPTTGAAVEYLAAVHENTFSLMTRRDPRELLETIVARAAAMAGTTHGYLCLADPAEGGLRQVIGLGMFGASAGLRIRRGAGVAGRVWASASPFVVADYEAWADRIDLPVQGPLGSVLGVPLTSGSDVIGTIGLASGDPLRTYEAADIAGLARFAQLASVALDNARQYAAARLEIATRARTEEALRASSERFRSLADASFEALVIHRDGVVLAVNRAFETLFGRPSATALGTPVLDLFPEAVRARVARQIVWDSETPYETVAVLQEGTRGPVELATRTVSYVDESPARATAIRDIRERRAIEERLVRQSLYDPLTGLPNRTLFLDRASHALASTRARRAAASVLLLDLDRFKLVNESLGHTAGDRLLVQVGRRFEGAIRPGDTLARLGGDEFAVFLAGPIGEEGARVVAERLVATLQSPFTTDRGDAYLAVSVGVAAARAGQTSAADLLRDAEIALYRAKADATTRVAVYAPSMSEASRDRMELESGLRRALDRGELRVHYQPLVDLHTGCVVGHEALVRWEHPDRGLLSPYPFIAMAEETGLIVALGDFVLSEACRQTRAWQLARPDQPLLSISVNLSARQFSRPDLPATVERVLTETGLPASSLELEITETVAMTDAESAALTLEALHKLGVRLVLDDFGTGYSSLSYLSRLPLDIIKVDRAFIAGLADADANESIIRAVAALAHGLGIQVTAEGIEREDQLSTVRALACDRGQGFLFAAPLTAEAAGAALAAGLDARGSSPGARAA